jgi:hypothetical protein
MIRNTFISILEFKYNFLPHKTTGLTILLHIIWDEVIILKKVNNIILY